MMNCRLAFALVILFVGLSLPACSSFQAAPESRGPVARAQAPEMEQSETPVHSEAASGFAWHTADTLRRDFALSYEDHQHFYSAENLTELALAIALAAPLANTRADRDVRDWYQEKIRSDETDRVANLARLGGEFWVTIPVCLGAALSGPLWEQREEADLPVWGNRSLRALAVGAPPMILTSVVLGAARPTGHSSWKPFQDSHGVSGHTFTGAVPFLTAAMMTDDPFWRTALVLGSFVTGWSRINDDRHYLSQVLLGWSMAYLAVVSVGETETGPRRFQLLPILLPDGPGFGLWFQY